MILKLNRLTIKNFKGVRDFELRIDGRKNVIVHGKNGTGKTTCADAFFWLFDDADLSLQSKFNTLMLDQYGNTIDHQEAQVEAEIDVDGKNICLSKIFRQKWTKKRGQAEAEFQGHTTKHFWGGVPIGKKEYVKRLAEIIDPALFRTLADPAYFCNVAKVDFRRDILIQLAGNVTDTTIIDQMPELAELKEALQVNDRSIEDHKTVMLEQRRELNRALQEIPTRIDELKKSMPEPDSVAEVELRDRLKTIEIGIDSTKNEILALGSGIALSEKRQEYIELEGQLNRLMPDYGTPEILATKEKVKETLDIIHRKRIKSLDLERDLNLLSDEMLLNANTRANLKTEWIKANNRQYQQSDKCFTCGQSLPADLISDQWDKFNKQKASDIKKIDARGQELFSEYHSLETKKTNYEKEIDALKLLIKQLVEKIEHYRQYEENAKSIIDKAHETEADRITAAMSAVQREIDQLNTDTAPERERLEKRLSELLNEKGKIESSLLEYTQLDRTLRRIEQLEKSLKENGKQYEQCEKQLYLIELFIRKKAEFIEENVSGFFSITRWKLFDVQVNQGIRDVCEATMGGVPYSTDLNTGAKINVGLDIINTLSKHYGVMLPIFVDNAESITQWMIDLDNQVVRLVAAANVEKLEVIDGD